MLLFDLTCGRPGGMEPAPTDSLRRGSVECPEGLLKKLLNFSETCSN
jgi:hypothetical protein